MTIRTFSLTVFLLTLVTLASLSVSPISAESHGTYVSDELLLKFKPETSRLAQESLLKAYGLRVKGEISQIKVKILSVNPNALEAVQKALSQNSLVEYVEKNMILSPEALPNDQYYPNEWHLSKIQAAQAWDISKGSPSVIIAILDSGVDSIHPDLSSKILSGWNFYDKNNNYADVYGHGTMVAGTAAALTNNSIGVAAIAWMPKILPIRVTDTSGYAYYSTLAQGLIYAADHGAKAAVMSFAIYSGSTLSDSAKYLYDRGGWAVAAGGNDQAYHNQSDNPYIISVSATSDDSLARFSSYGPYIDFSAPGVTIYTTVKGGGYGSVSGTSFSAPLTAGLISLIFSVNLSLTPSQVYDILKQSSRDLGTPGYDIYYGWGRIDAYQALLKASQQYTPPPDTTPPSCTITSPTDGAQVSGEASVNVDAMDNVGVTKVELYKDGNLLAVDTAAPYSFTWDTTSDPNGPHTLVTKAYDAANNIGSSNSVTVTVNNTVDTTAPIVTILSPTSATVNGQVTISASATDPSGIQRVEFYIDGKLKSTLYSTPYKYVWNTKSVKDGSHTITVKAYDPAGNMGQASVTVTVANRK